MSKNKNYPITTIFFSAYLFCEAYVKVSTLKYENCLFCHTKPVKY